MNRDWFKIVGTMVNAKFSAYNIANRMVNQNEGYPALVWHLSNTIPEVFKNGQFGVYNMALDISIYSKDINELERISKEVTIAFHGVKPADDFAGSQVVNMVDIPSGNDTVRREITINLITS